MITGTIKNKVDKIWTDRAVRNKVICVESQLI